MNLEWGQRLERIRFQLTKREQEIVSYLEEHFSLLQHLSIQDVVEATNTSRSTVHRFCVKMGYDGFKAFKEAMSEYNQGIKMPDAQFSPRQLTPKIASDLAMSTTQTPFELFQKGFWVDMQALERTAAIFTEEQIMRIVHLIRNAGTIYAVGYQTGLFPARFLAERLSRIKQKVQLATGEQRHIVDLVFPIAKDDLLFLCEYHKHFDFHRKLLEHAQKNNANTMLMTDYPTSPLVTRADETLIVHRGLSGFKNSLAVPMNVVNNLLLAVEFSLGDKCKEFLQEWDELND